MNMMQNMFGGGGGAQGTGQPQSTGGAQVPTDDDPTQGSQPASGAPNMNANPFAGIDFQQLMSQMYGGAPTTGQGQGQQGGGGTNPFAGIDMQQLMQQMYGGGQAPGFGGQGQQGGANPFAGIDMQQLMQQMYGGGAPASGGFGAPASGGFGGGAPPRNTGAGTGTTQPQQPQPTDEELKVQYAAQLQELHDMGFFDDKVNIQCLRESRGSTSIAVEKVLQKMGLS
ncbi:MAG: hypothetical protein EZS28_039814 [Streblomastix strix]|uniref:UBA domain-containing protein n=1 Tax=Streblomastix strix TaxID=222440 RepID=A0A5J4U3G2_9EUKA|nr:MAG: hypothetical protein EZS28_039814 [Streblomastix strix]